ncbi:MAG: HU family DNA-binding protein [Prevotella sp.]|nr:HU family DNA-binding protein [Prevotella sp.]
MAKLYLSELSAVLAEKQGIDRRTAQRFVTSVVAVVQSGLEADRLVKIKGLGTFKIIDVEARESVNVNTGERLVIGGHSKLTFLPDNTMKELVNKPFSQFETVILNDGVEFDDDSEIFNAADTEKEEPLMVESEEEKADTPEKAEIQEEEPAVLLYEEEELEGDSDALEVEEEEQEGDSDAPEVEEEEEQVEEPVAPEVEEEEEPVEEAVAPEVEVEEEQEGDSDAPEVEEEEEQVEEPVAPEVEEEEQIEEPVAPEVEEVEELVEEPVVPEAEEVEEQEGEPVVLEAEEEEQEPTETIQTIIDKPMEPENESKPTKVTLPPGWKSSIDNDEEPTPKRKRPSEIKLGWNQLLFAVLLALLIGGGAGYMIGRNNLLASQQEAPRAELAAKAEPAAKQADEKQTVQEPTAENPTDGKPAATETTAKAEGQPQTAEAEATDTPIWEKYDGMDPRTHNGYYYITGLDRIEKAKAGDNTARISRRVFGAQELACYIEVFNGIDGKTVLEEGTEVKIPKIESKKSVKKRLAQQNNQQ